MGESKKHGKIRVYMLEMLQLILAFGGSNAAVVEQMSEGELAEFIMEIPELEMIY